MTIFIPVARGLDERAGRYLREESMNMAVHSMNRAELGLGVIDGAETRFAKIDGFIVIEFRKCSCVRFTSQF